jgi:DNA phosphorothioation-dependent restriction protein DptH
MKITKAQRKHICELLEQKHDRTTIAQIVGVTPGQVSGVAAHLTMGTYVGGKKTAHQPDVKADTFFASTIQTVLDKPVNPKRPPGILLGRARNGGASLYWDPPNSVNPHVLILGESGFGKTYSISCLIAELCQRGIPSIIFDYGQGFSAASTDALFGRITRAQQLEASRDGIRLNPFEIFPSDLHGPVSVAQRVADTLARIYQSIGIQQHATIRDAVIDILEDAGIHKKVHETWERPLPRFGLLRQKLQEYAEDFSSSDRKTPRTAASHISSLFVFDIFRSDGNPIKWNDLLLSNGQPTVVQLRGIEQDLQRTVTEFMIWNLLGFLESTGPSKLRCFVVIDEAHRMISGPGSAIDKLLREGRKFGVGVILASQQPEDFTPVAFSNTATKLIFQISDDNSAISRRLYRKLHAPMAFSELYKIITTLPRGEAFAITGNKGAVVKFAGFTERFRTKAISEGT